MAADNRLETLQDEIKLLKGEVKQSLASVREYLLNMELPSSEFATILAALGGDGEKTVTMKGTLEAPKPEANDEDELTEIQEEEELDDDPETLPEDEDLLDIESPDKSGHQDGDTDTGTGTPEGRPDSNETPEDGSNENINDAEGGPVNEIEPEAELADDFSEDKTPDDGLDESGDEGDMTTEYSGRDESTSPEPEMEDISMDYERISAEVNQGIPRVNMLANLINWVARAKKEIGQEQLSTFLEVYGLSGHLSPELKEVMLHLVEITEDQPDATTTAEIWSQAMLSLHGILTGGDAPLHPFSPPLPDVDDSLEGENEDEIIEVDKPAARPITLKLVLPDSEGNDREFSLNLSPENKNE